VSLIPSLEGPPEPPESLQDAGAALWRHIWSTASWVGPTDEPLVTMLCRAADEVETLRELLRGEKLVTRTRAGVLRVHPAVGEIRTLERQMTTWLSLLGFTPTDRARLALGEVRAVGELFDFLARRDRDLK
jgi:P27 family predicted phage terminase small subunit